MRHCMVIYSLSKIISTFRVSIFTKLQHDIYKTAKVSVLRASLS